MHIVSSPSSAGGNRFLKKCPAEGNFPNHVAYPCFRENSTNILERDKSLCMCVCVCVCGGGGGGGAGPPPPPPPPPPAPDSLERDKYLRD